MCTPMPECMCGGQRGTQFSLSILGCENQVCAARAEQVLSAEPSHWPCFGARSEVLKAMCHLLSYLIVQYVSSQQFLPSQMVLVFMVPGCDGDGLFSLWNWKPK